MRTTTIQVRISPELRKQAETLFASMGIKMSDAIRLFLQQTVNCGGLPFQITASKSKKIKKRKIL
jgi:DNA-damage-inducible protein J